MKEIIKFKSVDKYTCTIATNKRIISINIQGTTNTEINEGGYDKLIGTTIDNIYVTSHIDPTPYYILEIYQDNNIIYRVIVTTNINSEDISKIRIDEINMEDDIISLI